MDQHQKQLIKDYGIQYYYHLDKYTALKKEATDIHIKYLAEGKPEELYQEWLSCKYKRDNALKCVEQAKTKFEELSGEEISERAVIRWHYTFNP